MVIVIRSFFHQRATARRKKKTIIKLKDDCGIWIDNTQHIASKFISDYKAQFIANIRGRNNLTDIQIRQVITDIDNIELVKLLDQEEVRQALFAIDSNKTPGPNGFGAGFFKHYWELVKDDFY